MGSRTLVQLGDVTPNNIGQVKRLNSVLFPVSYNPSFYTKLVEGSPPAHLSKIGTLFPVPAHFSRSLIPMPPDSVLQ